MFICSCGTFSKRTYLRVVVEMKAPWVHGSLPPATLKTSFSALASAFMKNDLPVLAAPQMVIRLRGFCGNFPSTADAPVDNDTRSEPFEPSLVVVAADVGPAVISSRLTDISTGCATQQHRERLGGSTCGVAVILEASKRAVAASRRVVRGQAGKSAQIRRFRQNKIGDYFKTSSLPSIVELFVCLRYLTASNGPAELLTSYVVLALEVCHVHRIKDLYYLI